MTLPKKPVGFERHHWHHIIPKHDGGTDDPSNLTLLTPSEHARAHYERYLEYGIIGDLRSANLLQGRIDGATWGDDRTGDKNPNYGNKWTDEQKQYMSQLKKGSTRSPDAIEKTAAQARGKKHSAEWSLKISLGVKGKNVGKVWSEETRAKIAATKAAMPKINIYKPAWTCLGCQTTGKGQSNFTRWHLSRCFKEN